MQPKQPHDDQRHWLLLQRLVFVAATILAGLLACGALLAVLGGQVPSALAAPASGPVIYPGGTGCTTTLQACIDNSLTGTTIVMLAGTYVTNGLTLGKPVSLTGVSSATVILKPVGAQRVLTVTSAAVDSSVIISGLTFAGGHAVGAGCPAGCGGAIQITATAQPLLVNLTISNSRADVIGGGLDADGSISLVMSGVAVLSNTSSSDGGGAAAEIGNVTLIGGLFQNNQCTGGDCQGGGLIAFNLAMTDTQFLSNTSIGNSGGGARVFGTAILNGGLFQGNQCTGSCFGGGLLNLNGLAVTKTRFLSNTSTFDGGGVDARSNATLNGATFQNNRCTVAGCFGGGLGVIGDLTLSNSDFVSNTSTSGGGGAHASRNVTLTVDLFQDNQCTGSFCAGGGLDAVGNLIATNSHFLRNISQGDGGGAKVNGNVTLNGGSFENNQCTGLCAGGGLDAIGSLTATNTQFLTNTSIGPGGGASAGTVTLSGSLFQNNNCTGITFCLGGGLRAQNLAATNSQFLGNTSTGDGGGAFSQFGIVTLTEDVFQNNRCTGANCQGGALFAENDLAVTNTLFVGNTGQQGAGLYQGGGSGRLVNDLFAANQASVHGDEVFLASPGTVTLLFNTMASPTLGSGAAIYVTSGTVVLTNTLLASYSVGIENAGGSVSEDYTLFAGVTTHLSGTVAGCGNCFTGPAGFVNPAAGDYHLALGSLAIDHGVDAGITFDLDGNPRPLGAGFDIGCYEANIRHLFLPLVRR